MKYRILSFAALGVLLAAASVDASYTVNFGDNTKNWPGYAVNGTDEIGVPIFPAMAAGSATLSNDNKLESITFSYKSLGASGWSLLKPGDLFLDVDLNPGWDYVARHSGTTAAGSWALYSFAADIALSNVCAYQLVGRWPGYTVRTDHPWALKNSYFANGTVEGNVGFDGWKNPGPTETATSTFDLSALGLTVDKLVLSFTVNCANDVVYENVPLQSPTGSDLPEPASVIVWGLLSLTFAGGSWRLAFLRRPPRSPKTH